MEKFKDIQIPEYLLQNYVPTICVQNFKPISSFLAVQWLTNQVREMTSHFGNSIFGISNSRTTNNDIFGILRQNWTRKVCFKRKILI